MPQSPIDAAPTPLREDLLIHAATLGDAWISVADRILADGRASSYDGLPILEVATVTLVVADPDPADRLIERYAEPDRLAWMRANFTDRARVAELGNADSYATRLYDYDGSGRDQVGWVVVRLRRDPSSRSATITTFQPLTDTSYIPCVSLLDFWIPDGALDLVVYAHSIDFGAKGYGNLVQLAELQHQVAGELVTPVGRLTMTIKSAHVYDTEAGYLQGVVRSVRGTTGPTVSARQPTP